MELTEAEKFLVAKIVSAVAAEPETRVKPNRRIVVVDLTVPEIVLLPRVQLKLERAVKPTQLTHLDSGLT